jgi:hypothetical protein
MDLVRPRHQFPKDDQPVPAEQKAKVEPGHDSKIDILALFFGELISRRPSRLCPLAECFPTTDFPDDCGVPWVNQAGVVRCLDGTVGVLYWTCSEKLSVGP